MALILFIIISIISISSISHALNVCKRPYTTIRNPQLSLLSFSCLMNELLSDYSHNEYYSLGIYAYPALLDSVPRGQICNATGPCFETVLPTPITDGSFQKIDSTTYLHIASGVECTYSNTDGAFRCAIF
jgi:hypothetical protein